jgi:hypothetical protein
MAGAIASLHPVFTERTAAPGHEVIATDVI